jgi:hypothetical protein
MSVNNVDNTFLDFESLLDKLKNTITDKISEIIPKVSDIIPKAGVIDETAIDKVKERLTGYFYVGIALYALLIILLLFIIYLVSK